MRESPHRPGNGVDPARRSRNRDTDEEYAREPEYRLVPVYQYLQQNHTAVRIGVNHGSLSDRIRNRCDRHRGELREFASAGMI